MQSHFIQLELLLLRGMLLCTIRSKVKSLCNICRWECGQAMLHNSRLNNRNANTQQKLWPLPLKSCIYFSAGTSAVLWRIMKIPQWLNQHLRRNLEATEKTDQRALSMLLTVFSYRDKFERKPSSVIKRVVEVHSGAGISCPRSPFSPRLPPSSCPFAFLPSLSLASFLSLCLNGEVRLPGSWTHVNGCRA